MTERLVRMTDEQLGAGLGRLGDELAWPGTPDVAGAVIDAIREERSAPSLVAPRLSMPSRRRTLLVIAAALLALAGVALAARFVIELGAISIEVLPGRPTALPTSVATDEDFGREVSLSDAGTIAGFAPETLSALGPPDRTWVDEAEVGPEPGDVAMRIVNAWAPNAELPAIPGTRTGAVLMQFEGDWEVASKLLFEETDRFGDAFVEGRDAFWTTGEHELVILRGDEAMRLLVSGNVLIWQDAGFTFRLETALPKQAAVAIAESLQPATDPG